MFQLISLESIIELGRVRKRRKIQDEMRALALNVFLQCRRLLSHNSTVRSLTGFGTAAAADLFLKNKDVSFPESFDVSLKNLLHYEKVLIRRETFTVPFVLYCFPTRVY